MKLVRNTVVDWIGEKATKKLEDEGVAFVCDKKLTLILTELVTERYKAEQRVRELEEVIEVLLRY